MIFNGICIFVAIMIIALNLEALGRLFKVLMAAIFAPFVLIGRIFDRHH